MYDEHRRTSFEFFPPRNGEASDTLLKSVKRVSDSMNPARITMTYGAGGSGFERTPLILKEMSTVTDVSLASHLVYLRQTKEELGRYLDLMQEMGITHIVALRGEERDGFSPHIHPDYFQNSADFVRFIKNRGFQVSVAAYPEKHPFSPDLETDMDFFKAKCEAGADEALTQFFFDNNSFYDFRERAAKSGITVPIIPGLAPVKNYAGMVSFATRIGTRLTESLCQKFNAAARIEDHQSIAIDLMTDQITDLQRNGVENIHFYSLNNTAIIEAACRNTGLAAPAAAP